MTPDVYNRLIALLDRTGGASTLRQETFPRIPGGRKHNGRFDMEVAYALSAHGIGFEDERVVGKPTQVPHRESDEIKDAVARLGWLPGVPSPDVLRAMDSAEARIGYGGLRRAVAAVHAGGESLGQRKKRGTPARVWDEEKAKEIIATYLSGANVRQTAIQHGENPGAIHRLLHQRGVPMHPQGGYKRPESYTVARKNRSREMSASYLQGRTVAELAKEHKIKEWCVRYLLKSVDTKMRRGRPLGWQKRMKPQA